ncbi:MAG: hypothetical protein QG588_1145 [Candidatus Poribacteria bacterium]|nr:hypothetical protein [Candidatus Poribacteria bacterium]
MKNLIVLGMTLVFIVGFSTILEAKVLFSDNFESGLSNRWIFSERGGNDVWKVVTESGNHILQKTGSLWTIISVDGVGSPKDYKELWAIARIRCDVATADEGTELGLLINPDTSNGNWYFALRGISGQAGFDELAVAWHDLVPYKSWKVKAWHYSKVAVIDKTLYGKAWLEGEDEPADWLTKTTLTNHLEEDGVGFAVDTNEVSFDDLIVADSEAGLVPSAVESKYKLSTTWGRIKNSN